MHGTVIFNTGMARRMVRAGATENGVIEKTKIIGSGCKSINKQESVGTGMKPWIISAFTISNYDNLIDFYGDVSPAKEP